jgi:hypothetical protein
MTEPATNVAAMPALRESAPLARAVTQPMTPMEMLSVAVSSGSGIEVIERLMTLQERWSAAQARRAFDEAIAAAKAKIKPIRKNKRVHYASKDKEKANTDYMHETMGEIARTIDPILAEHGLSYRYRTEQGNGNVTVTCIVSHKEGHSEETPLTSGRDEGAGKNNLQALGSALTYLQRYTLKIALGLAAAADDDGKAAEGPAKITDEQVDQLIALADAAEADKGKFCEWLEVPSIADIPAKQFAKAKNALEMARRKKMSRADRQAEDAAQGEVS